MFCENAEIADIHTNLIGTLLTHNYAEYLTARHFHITPLAEPRLPLLDERGHAFLLVLAREQAGEALRLADQVLDVVPLERMVHRGLGCREREWALRGQTPGDFAHPVHQLPGLVDR